MPKLKTHRGTSKRFKLTAKNKLTHLHAFGSHFLQKKSGSRKRSIATESAVKGKLASNIKRALGA